MDQCDTLEQVVITEPGNKLLNLDDADIIKYTFICVPDGHAYTGEQRNKLGIRYLKAPPLILQNIFTKHRQIIAPSLIHLSILFETNTVTHVIEYFHEVDGMLKLLLADASSVKFMKFKRIDIPLYKGKLAVKEKWEVVGIKIFKTFMLRISELFGSTLEIWSGSLPPIPGMTKEFITGRLLAGYKTIRSIQLAEVTVGGLENAEAFVRCLAEPNESLKRVVIEKVECGVTEGTGVEYRITRDKSGSCLRLSKHYWSENNDTSISC